MGKDKNYVKKNRLFVQNIDKDILRECCKKMERLLTQDELFIVCKSIEGTSFEDISHKFSNDRQYAINILNELLTNNVVKDCSGVIKINSCKYVSEVEMLKQRIAELEEENDTLKFKLNLYKKVTKAYQMLRTKEVPEQL